MNKKLSIVKTGICTSICTINVLNKNLNDLRVYLKIYCQNFKIEIEISFIILKLNDCLKQSKIKFRLNIQQCVLYSYILKLTVEILFQFSEVYMSNI